MTGWRLGYACAPKELIKQMVKIHQFAIMCAPTTSQYAAISALKNGEKDVEMMVRAYNQRRRFLMDSFRKMNLECFEPYGAFYVFPCIKEFGMTSEEFATRFLEEEKGGCSTRKCFWKFRRRVFKNFLCLFNRKP